MVIIPEICITQVSGIIRNFAADMKKIVLSIIMLAMTTMTNAQNVQNKATKTCSLQLEGEWDKTFPKSDKVRHEKVTFSNRFGITLAADLYIPKETNGKWRPLPSADLSADEKPIQGYSNVTFEPGCRNNWHIHHGAHQILICVSGKGWYQEWGKPAIPLTPGDIIDIPEGVKHWHGAQADSWFQHLATHVKTSGEERNSTCLHTYRRRKKVWR